MLCGKNPKYYWVGKREILVSKTEKVVVRKSGYKKLVVPDIGVGDENKILVSWEYWPWLFYIS